MSSWIKVYFVGVILSSILCACETSSPSIENFNIVGEFYEIPAPSLHKDTNTIQVFLPEGYDAAGTDISIVYFLHGWGSDAGAFERLSGVEHLKNLENSNLAVLSINGGTSGYFDWEDGLNNWETHVTADIETFIKRTFPQMNTEGPAAVYGVSMGGDAALRLAMKYPQRFSCAAAHSPAIGALEFDSLPDWQKSGFREMEDFNRRYGDPFNPERWKTSNTTYFATEFPVDDLRRAKYYFDVGRDDQLGFDVSSSKLSQILSERHIPHIYALKDGRHGADFVTKNMPDALRFLQKCLTENR